MSIVIKDFVERFHKNLDEIQLQKLAYELQSKFETIHRLCQTFKVSTLNKDEKSSFFQEYAMDAFKLIYQEDRSRENNENYCDFVDAVQEFFEDKYRPVSAFEAIDNLIEDYCIADRKYVNMDVVRDEIRAEIQSIAKECGTIWDKSDLVKGFDNWNYVDDETLGEDYNEAVNIHISRSIGYIKKILMLGANGEYFNFFSLWDELPDLPFRIQVIVFLMSE